MNTRIIATVSTVAGLLALGATAGYWWAHRTMPPAEPTHVADSTGTASISAGQRKILYWHDPMVPNVRFDKPGKSPFMDMELVPVYADEENSGGVRVSPNVVQNLGIRLSKVERAALSNRLRAVGSVAFDERLLEVVQARVDGYITRLAVKAPLATVHRGQALATILAPQWLEAQQQYLALLDAESDRARVIRDAARQRLVVLGVPEATIKAVETTRKTSAASNVAAPIDGVVTELGVREGAAFTAGMTLFRINGLSTVWANAQIPEAKISFIPAGSGVEAQATAWPGVTFVGRVIALLPEVDVQTRTVTARVALDNPDSRLSPGMFVSLDFTGPAGEPQLVVPSEALIATGERNVVIVARDGGEFDVVNVTVGTEQDGKTAILSGLTEGQSIVVSGQFLIDSEASLKSTVNRLQGPASPAETATQSPSAASTAHLARGTVTALAPEQVTIAHEPVPSLKWPAMTMGFKAPPHGLPKDLAVGDRVSFAFVAGEAGTFQIERISVLENATERAP
jgi:Cu(I)/Ag(I) efflux system membrane fusion protein